jgi:hypothetical protein
MRLYLVLQHLPGNLHRVPLASFLLIPLTPPRQAMAPPTDPHQDALWALAVWDPQVMSHRFLPNYH